MLSVAYPPCAQTPTLWSQETSIWQVLTGVMHGLREEVKLVKGPEGAGMGACLLGTAGIWRPQAPQPRRSPGGWEGAG